jgi:6-phosphogluconolactonase (cycloisomerase 2 family)
MYVPYTLAVAAWTIDPASGALTPVAGSPFSVGIDPRGVTVDPTGRFVFLADLNSSKVAAMAVNPATGALSPTPGSPFEAGATGFSSAAVEPTGHFVYFASSGSPNGPTFGNGPIAAFAINQSNGSLTPVTGSPFQAGINLAWITVASSGRFLYATDAGDGGPGQVVGFAIQASGDLIPIPGSPWSAPVPLGALAVDPGSSFAYAAGSYGNPQVFAYAIDHGTGALTPLAGSPYPSGVATDAAIDPGGKFLYLAESADSAFMALSIDSTSGALSQVTGFPLNVSPSPYGLTLANVPAKYSICPQYDTSKAVKSGATIPIKLLLCDASGNDLSASSITAHAVSVTQVSTSISGPVEDAGNSNPDNDFRHDPSLGTTGGYIFNLKTTGMSTGTYALEFNVTGDSSTYSAPFQVK